jgi:hypothetical protein
MFRIMHLLEGVAVLLGLIILGAMFVNLSVAEAAGLPDLLVSQHSHPLVGFAGFTLATLPLTRRMAHHLLFNSSNVVEFNEMTLAVRRLGLLNRVQAVNVYLADLPDSSWNNVFPSDVELWAWLGEAYEDEALRKQMHPDVMRRAAQAAPLARRAA